MKVAISLPDPLFSAAEKLAQRLAVSRSQLYASALVEYLDKRRDPAVTARLDAVYGAADSSIDSALAGAQAKVLAREAW